MRTIRRSTARWALLVLTTLLLVACAGSSGAILSNVGAPIDNGGGGPAAAPSFAPPAPGEGTGNGEGDGLGAPVDDAKIIRTGTISLEVGDVAVSVQSARDRIRALGGYIGASQTRTDGDTPVATVTYRIPADRWEEALDLLRHIDGTGTKIVSEQTEAVEVTGQVVDLEARIRNLRASETALQGIAANAVKIADVLAVQDQLTQVRGQIESLTAALKDLTDRAAFATLTASFSVPVVAVEVAQEGWDPSVVVDEASASLINVLQALTTAGIWFAIVWLPIIVVMVVIAAIVLFIARRLGFRRQAPPSGEAAAS